MAEKVVHKVTSKTSVPSTTGSFHESETDLEEGCCTPLSPIVGAPHESTRSEGHPLEEHNQQAVECMRFIKLDALLELLAPDAGPLPRCQDLPDECFGTLRARDKLLAISHGWKFQVHPDPYGVETDALREILERVEDRHQNGGTIVLCFLDFLAIPQRPFAPGQAERTPEENRLFDEGLKHLDAVFLKADIIVHVDVPARLPPEEGEEFSAAVPVAPLRYAQVGDRVVCVGPYDEEQPEAPAGTRQCAAFDTIRSVDGEAVQSIDDVNKCLHNKTTAEVSFERHRHGLPNLVSCDDRGWIYLERFITMVVVAMSKDMDFENMIYSNRFEILKSLHHGARDLRQSARKDALRKDAMCTLQCEADNVGYHLNIVLTGYEEALEKKKFSNASIDKAINPDLRNAENGEAPVTDDEKCRRSMKEVMTHLRGHWDNEEQRRHERNERSLAMRNFRKFTDYAVVWKSFTPNFVERLETETGGNNWVLVAPVVLPVVCALVGLLMPYARPDSGLRNNWLHIVAGFPWFAFTCYLYVPQWLQVSMGVTLPKRCTLLWPFLAAILTTLPVALVSASTGVYPLPFAPITAALSYICCLPGLWWLIPAEKRAEEKAKRKFCWGIVAQLACSTIFCFIYPFLNVLVSSAQSDVEKFILVISFLFVRIIYERVVEGLVGWIGPDVLPAGAFLAEVNYQVALCDFLRRVQCPSTVAAVLLANLLENAYYLLCIATDDESPSVHETGDSDGIGKRVTKGLSFVSNQSSASSRSRKITSRFCDGSSKTVAAVLLLRHFADIVVPLQYTVLFAVLSKAPIADNILWVAHMDTNKQLLGAVQYLLSGVAIEIVLVVVTFLVLRRRGVRPLSFLRGVMLAGNPLYYTTALVASVVYSASINLVHSGCDFSFALPWIHGNTTWISGPTWVA